MLHDMLRPQQALSRAYLQPKTDRSGMEQFKGTLRNLLNSLESMETEEQASVLLHDFLKSILYVNHGVSIRGHANLVIHIGNSTKSNVGVLLLVRQPSDMTDIPTSHPLSDKVMYELLLCFLREREKPGYDLRHLIVTSVREWFVFDTLELDRLFYHNPQLMKDFADWSKGRKGSGMDLFYKEIVASVIANRSERISYTYFNLKDYDKPLRNADLHGEKELVALYHLLSPPHLLKERPGAGELEGNSSPVCYAHLKGLREGFGE